ncbi:hypothetical protein KSW81_006136 [Nannochloris sp. 'desiccata']|nr:hypothetical protein KSW81_006136 [Chlorella desiccata (nom. nud.)]
MRLGGDDTRSRWLAAAFITFGFSSASRCSDLCTMKYKAMFTTTQDTNPVQHCLLNVKKDGNTKTNRWVDLLVQQPTQQGRAEKYNQPLDASHAEHRRHPSWCALFSGYRRTAWRVQVPDARVDVVLPGVRRALKMLLEQREGLKCHEKEIGAETFLHTLLYLGMVFWQNLPLKYHKYQDRYTLAHLKGINGIMQTVQYKKFAEEVLDKERRAIEKIENRQESSHGAPPRVAVEVPKASIKVYASHLIAFGDCRACSDLWNLWERERPIINSIIQRGDVKQAHGLTIQKGRLEAVVRVIVRLAEENCNLQNGIHALQVVLEKLDAKEKSLGGRAGISISTFVEALQGVVNTTDMQKLQSNIKGRTKVTKLDLKNMLDAHWQTTTSWPAVQWAEAEQAGA